LILFASPRTAFKSEGDYLELGSGFIRDKRKTSKGVLVSPGSFIELTFGNSTLSFYTTEG
jgi:hypothetical protein